MATHITTSTGFELDIEENKADDMEVLELVFAIEDNDMHAYLKLIDKLLSTKTKERLYDHVRVNGRVPITAVANELTDILKGMQSKKK